MRYLSYLTTFFAALAMAVTAVSCNSQSQTAPLSTSSPAPSPKPSAPQIFDGTQYGIRFGYPVEWEKKQGGTAVFKAVSSDDNAQISLDVPSVSKFEGAMASPQAVVDGYVKDLKKNRIHDGSVEQSDENVPSAKAKRVKITGHENGKPSIDEAVVMIHNDKIYILSVDSDDTHYSTAKNALDNAISSIHWTR